MSIREFSTELIRNVEGWCGFEFEVRMADDVLRVRVLPFMDQSFMLDRDFVIETHVCLPYANAESGKKIAGLLNREVKRRTEVRRVWPMVAPGVRERCDPSGSCVLVKGHEGPCTWIDERTIQAERKRRSIQRAKESK